MKLAVAQVQAERGNIQLNIKKHLEMIDLAINQNVDLIAFPELSLTGYEPKMAKELALLTNDARLAVFQEKSDLHNITICVGSPLREAQNVEIGLIIFQPNSTRKSYAKQLLHEDELPYFKPGVNETIIQLNDVKIAPAICYESMQAAHVNKAIASSADYYLVSVAKDQEGMDSADQWFTKIALNSELCVLVANSIGPCEDFVSAGASSVWHSKNKNIQKMSCNTDGILIWDTQTASASVFSI